MLEIKVFLGGQRCGFLSTFRAERHKGQTRYPMIDWNRVSQLRDEVGSEDFEEVVALFFSEVESVVTQLQDAPDQQTLALKLHFLRSGALNLGFEDLAALCEEEERRAGDGLCDDAGIERVQTNYAVSKQGFLSGLGDLLRD
ncbi:Hpt domain-containing protein [Marimonas sp. MJW-29]|uniref:Hpt domain-containing protein n=1 Tax=Sulfitobacter sediminis TaxID=3234186 RepID=A0ABV3RNS2_9RHOB